MFLIKARRPRRSFRPSLDGLPTRIMPTDIGGSGLPMFESDYVLVSQTTQQGEQESPEAPVECSGPQYQC